MKFLFPILLVMLGGLGCSNTIVKLTGTPGAQVSGHYRADHVSSDFSGSAAWEMSLGSQELKEFEFRKSNPADTVELQIRKGHTDLVQATAGPGVVGMRAFNEGGWKSETLK